jgi:hypothetical protein
MSIRLGFDSYTNRARLAPAVLVVLPAGLAFIAWFPRPGFESALGGVAITLSFGMLFSNLARDTGRKAERKLLALWGGFPTLSMLRHRNSAGNAVTRERYHTKLRSLLPGTAIPTAAAESFDPDAADAVYESCIQALREKTRDTKKFPLVFEENVGYGFRRNLWGVKPAGVALSVIGLVGCGARIVVAASDGTDIPAAALVGTAINALLFAVWIARVTPTWVYDSAYAYAERLLAACEEL